MDVYSKGSPRHFFLPTILAHPVRVLVGIVFYHAEETQRCGSISRSHHFGSNSSFCFCSILGKSIEFQMHTLANSLAKLD